MPIHLCWFLVRFALTSFLASISPLNGTSSSVLQSGEGVQPSASSSGAFAFHLRGRLTIGRVPYADKTLDYDDNDFIVVRYLCQHWQNCDIVQAHFREQEKVMNLPSVL